MDPFTSSNYGMLRVRPRAFSGFSTDEDEFIELDFSSDSGVERERREVIQQLNAEARQSAIGGHNNVAAAMMVAAPLQYEKKKKLRKQASKDTIIRLKNKDFKIKSRDAELFEDDVHQEGALDEAEYKELFKHEYRSVFTKIVTSEEYRQVIMPFLNVTSDQQQQLLGKSSEKRGIHVHTEEDTAASRYSHIDRQARMAIRRQYGPFIKEFEQVLVDFIQHGADRDDPRLPLILVFQDGFGRFVAHGVCQYYQLKSSSVEYNGQRVTVISKPTKVVELPPTSLCLYLKHLKEQEQTLDKTLPDQQLEDEPFLPFSSIQTRTFVRDYKNKKKAKKQETPSDGKVAAQKKKTTRKKRFF
ncbi:hypothetical protein AKO1_001733 [Acrasis kona]|uniref:R3HDM4 n=1 Tax=Acrasis kona TaxID=1008807 RepID=A0AAW2ZA05_9EUKA